jgi:hypothetical protein
VSGARNKKRIQRFCCDPSGCDLPNYKFGRCLKHAEKLGSKEIARLAKMTPLRRYEAYKKTRLGSDPRPKKWEWTGDSDALIRKLSDAKVAAQERTR